MPRPARVVGAGQLRTSRRVTGCSRRWAFDRFASRRRSMSAYTKRRLYDGAVPWRGVIQWRYLSAPRESVRRKEGRHMTTPPPDLSTILQSIDSWSPEERLRLARTLLDQVAQSRPRHGSLASPEAVPTPRSSSFEALYGLASTGGPPPSDEQVAAWLDERRMRHLSDADAQDGNGAPQ